MSNLNITDGEPITYDFLQQVATRITRLESRLNANSGRNSVTNQKISVAGPGFNNIRDITIICDSQDLDINQKKEYKFNVKFEGANFASVPHIVATVADTGDGPANDPLRAPFATVSIGKVTRNGFECRVDLIKVGASNTKIKVNYIAIGKTSQQ